MIRQATVQRVVAMTIALSLIAIAVATGVVSGQQESQNVNALRAAGSHRAIAPFTPSTRAHVSAGDVKRANPAFSQFLWIVSAAAREPRLAPVVRAFEIAASVILLRNQSPQLCRAPPLA